jgi:DNA-binding CsgD family transcriptional regulator
MGAESSRSRLVVGSFDSEWRINRISVDIELVLEVPVRDMVGRSLSEVVHPDDLAGLFAAAADCLVDRAGVKVTARWHHGNGDWVPFRCVITRLAGEVLRFGFALLDGATDDEDENSLARAEVLERHLRRIAQEVEASGVVASVGHSADLTGIPGLSDLSSREWDVLDRLRRGQRVPAIARELALGQSTVRNHLSGIFRKVGVHSQVELLDLLQGKSPPSGEPAV